MWDSQNSRNQDLSVLRKLLANRGLTIVSDHG